MGKKGYVEVCQKENSTLSKGEVNEIVMNTLKKHTSVTLNKNLLSDGSSELQRLMEHFDSIMVSTNDEEIDSAEMGDLEELRIHTYRLSLEEAATETMQHDSEELSVATHVVLPSTEYQGLWESLYYDSNIKGNLLNFVETAMMFSERKVDSNIISWNKVILLHGPPGTGKTSLCKAIAQKAAIRLGNKYDYAELVEINSHSLFSKWFSESGKLVMKLFDEVKRLLENPAALVCVLIDEVESLAHARKACTNGTEPSDAIRVVNALLTQLDQIKRYPNVLILTTSNVTEAIDLAFVDRADIKQFIGHPQTKAIYQIYASCLQELIRTKFITDHEILPMDRLRVGEIDSVNRETRISNTLLSLSEFSLGLSGRFLRKIPFLTHAMHVHSSECTLEDFLQAMRITIETQKNDDLSVST